MQLQQSTLYSSIATAFVWSRMLKRTCKSSCRIAATFCELYLTWVPRRVSELYMHRSKVMQICLSFFT